MAKPMRRDTLADAISGLEGGQGAVITNSGMSAPDICAPTSTTTVAYGGNFGGTTNQHGATGD